MMTRVQIEQQAHDLRYLVCQNARLDGFHFDVVLDAIDRARDLGFQHIATMNRFRHSAALQEHIEALVLIIGATDECS